METISGLNCRMSFSIYLTLGRFILVLVNIQYMESNINGKIKYLSTNIFNYRLVERSGVFAPKINFLIPISLQPNEVKP